MSADPYLTYIIGESERVENDLTSFRSRSLTVLTTSSGVIALITATIAFAASESETKAGISDQAIVSFGLSVAAFIVATILALLINRSAKVKRPSGDSLIALTGEAWIKDAGEHERHVAEATARFVQSMHTAIDKAAKLLNWAIVFQIAGLILAGIAGMLAATVSA